jgi:DNA invertase Pin-like site-specific DNA recombinase
MLRIGYARVSTQDQSVDMQIAAMDRYGIHRECIFTDTLSGAHGTRDPAGAAPH